MIIPPPPSSRRENNIQRRMLKELKERGCVAVKTMSQSLDGWPDITAITPHGRVLFIEMKDEKGSLSEQQDRILWNIGLYRTTAAIVYGLEGVRLFLKDYDDDRIPHAYVVYGKGEQ